MLDYVVMLVKLLLVRNINAVVQFSIVCKMYNVCFN